VKKLLIHTEYLCILNLLSLPFLVMFYNRGTMMLWAMFIFLDAAELLLRLDEKKVLAALKDDQLKTETLRIKIYLIANVVFYIGIPFAASWKLLLLILLNDIISSGLSLLFQKYIFQDESLE